VKFSEDFYRKLGHETVDELVNWFNQVDSTYRGDLRELNEHNFARFDAKLEQRVAQLEAKLDQRVTQLEAKLEQRVTQLEAKLNQGLSEVRADLAVQDAQLERRLAELGGQLRAELHAQSKMLLVWMVGLWITAVAAQYFLPAVRP
jgi:BMFP domain-containing protein YqiC